jgi:hypothetical protein
MLSVRFPFYMSLVHMAVYRKTAYPHITGSLYVRGNKTALFYSDHVYLYVISGFMELFITLPIHLTFCTICVLMMVRDLTQTPVIDHHFIREAIKGDCSARRVVTIWMS